MTNDEPQIENVGNHHYAVAIREGDDLVELMVYADPAVVALITTDQGDERPLVAATMRYLLRRQSADDLPTLLDLADVAAGYDSWVEDIRRQMDEPDTAGGDHEAQT